MIVIQPYRNNKVVIYACKEKPDIYESVIPTNLDHEFKVEKLNLKNPSKAEKEFNDLVKYAANIYDENHDPFIFNLLTSKKLFIRFNKKSSSLLIRNSSKRYMSVKTIQKRRQKIDKIYPYKITLNLNYREFYFIQQFITTRHYFANRLCSIGMNQEVYDICFKTEKSLNKFIKNYVKGKLPMGTQPLKLSNCTRMPLYGKLLKNYLHRWKKINYMPNFDCFNTLFMFASDNKYHEKLKEVHRWARKNLSKRFLMMGTFPEIWLFEDEDDMNFFRIRWT